MASERRCFHAPLQVRAVQRNLKQGRFPKRGQPSLVEKHKKKVCALLERIKGDNAGDCTLEMSEG